MSDLGKPAATKEIPVQPPPPPANSQVAAFAARRDEVARTDHEEFQAYLQAKQAHARAAREEAKTRTRTKTRTRLTRRGILTAATGTAIAAEAASLAYDAMTGGASGSGAPGGAVAAEAQRQPINREIIDSRSDVGGRSLGRWIALLPTKLGGGTYALDLNSNRVLASIWYWTYGDFNPISHHLCAFPSADPYNGFEFVNSTQGGKNSLIYGIPTNITDPAPGFNIYRVRYDGSQMQLVENVSEATGLGLGVHVTVNPKDAQSYFVTDGQKDIAACFDRNDVAGQGGAEVRLEGEFAGAVARMAGWRRADNLPDLSATRRPGSTTTSAPRARRSSGKWCRWASCSSRRGRCPAMIPSR